VGDQGVTVGELFVGLVHYPVLNKRGEVIATSVTNLDIHDIARAAHTYGVRRYFIINPSPSQRRLVGRIIDHWVTGYGMSYNPDRGEALGVVDVAESLSEAIEKVAESTGKRPVVVGTSAGTAKNGVSFVVLRRMIEDGPSPCLLLFGTGWGMSDEVKETCAYMIEPIRGRTDYRHLSVRSAAAIVLDRLMGQNDTERSYS
jgi:hypothetical protein